MADPFAQKLEYGVKLLNEHRYVDAAAIFDAVCEACPGHQGGVIGSAVALSRMYDCAGVEARFNELQTSANVSAEVWITMAMMSRGLHRPQWEREFFTKAISLPGPSAEAFGLFALFLERSNDLDHAREISTSGLKIDPSNQTCLLAKARVLRREKSLEPAEAVLHGLLKTRGARTQTLIDSLYELAKIHDDRDEFAGAMSALAKAKQMVLASPDYAFFQRRAPIVEQNKLRFLTTLNAEYFKRAGEWEPSERRPIALLGGHPRSGTTLLEQVLDAHTGIISGEEIPAFDAGVCGPFLNTLDMSDPCAASLRMPASRIEQLRSGYFRTMESVIGQPISNRLLIDKNPTYTDWIPVYARVFPECKYIIALRDPRDVVLSCYFQNLPLNASTIRFGSLRDTAMRYCNTMLMWSNCRENMDPQKWIEVRYESLVNDVGRETSKVMQKLDLEPQTAQLQPDAHAKARTVFSPTYADVIQPINSAAIGKWKRYEPWLAEAMPILEPMIKMFGY